MKFYFPESFPVTTSKGYLEYEYGKRTLLTAPTRAGKTSATSYFLASTKSQEPDVLCIAFGPNMVNFVSDIKEKFEYFEHFQELDAVAVSYKEDRELFMAELGGISNQVNVLCVNTDYQYVLKIIPYIKAIKNRKIIVVIDEAHKAGDKTYKRILTELQADNIAVIETTATFRTRLLTFPPATYIQTLVPRTAYVRPTSATLIPFMDNDWVYENTLLHETQLQAINEELMQDECLVLINGYDKLVFHYAFKRQLKEYINSSDVAIVLLNDGSAFWTTAEPNSVENKLLHKNHEPIRAASSAISAVYELGFRHVIVIGHKQVAEGQTIGCSKLSLTLQIRGTPKSKPNADALVQSIRTGGLNINHVQKIMTDTHKWRDYLAYIEANEELVALFQDKTPEQQQELAEQAYLSLPTLKISHGDYTPVRKHIDTVDVGSHYFELPISSFSKLFEYSNTDSTAELYKYVRSAVKQQPWYSNQPLTAKKANGTPSDKIIGRGNDIQVHVNADPQSKEAKTHPLVFWRRDDVIAVRYTFMYEPCKTHNYWGVPESFAHTKDIILQVA